MSEDNLLAGPIHSNKIHIVVSKEGTVRVMEHEGDFEKGDYIVAVENTRAGVNIRTIFAEE